MAVLCSIAGLGMTEAFGSNNPMAGTSWEAIIRKGPM